MSESNVTETFTVVAFRYDQAKSTRYEKLKDESAVANEVFNALWYDKADVISIRRVYQKRPEV